jgi:hypothetical protein
MKQNEHARMIRIHGEADPPERCINCRNLQWVKFGHVYAHCRASGPFLKPYAGWGEAWKACGKFSRRKLQV